MSTVQVDAINESTTNAGVTVDGVLIKDGQVDGVDVSALNTTVSETGLTLEAKQFLQMLQLSQ